RRLPSLRGHALSGFRQILRENKGERAKRPQISFQKEGEIAMGVSAIVGGGLLGGGLGLFGASEQANAQESAAQTSADANTAAAQLQYQEWLQQQANMQPWLTAGTG